MIIKEINALVTSGLTDRKSYSQIDIQRDDRHPSEDSGENRYIIGKSLGHKSQQSTAIYARLNLDPVRESVNKATDVMFGYMGVNTDDELE